MRVALRAVRQGGQVKDELAQQGLRMLVRRQLLGERLGANPHGGNAGIHLVELESPRALPARAHRFILTGFAHIQST